jgi:hypothetical protein
MAGEASTGAGKGDWLRPVDHERYAANYDAAFGKCKDHPDYKVIRPPTADCIVCRRLWREKRFRDDSESTK